MALAGITIDSEVHCFTRMGTNRWVYTGSYNVQLWGELTEEQMLRLPPRTSLEWAKGIAKSDWGRRWMAQENAQLCAHQQIVVDDADNILQALMEGRVRVGFTVQQCVGFSTDLFDKLMGEFRNPTKPPKKKPAKKSSKKKGTGRGGDVKKEEDNDDDQEDVAVEEEDSEEEEGDTFPDPNVSRRRSPVVTIKTELTSSSRVKDTKKRKKQHAHTGVDDPPPSKRVK
ncbi:hypothetical protein BDV98DRAFT_85580 [Pterulicium gracile]|uniref:DUF6697 domain-containing protein n=1 Tax=Pterulicium gracile TaxID=1884261 RepID=A0A5C3QIL1_9AGAR|nr:hypothetical protein BDV98DRAFT_85580 [Pterula gracilis]